MTALQQQAIALIRHMPDEQIAWFIHAARARSQAEIESSLPPASVSRKAYQALQKYRAPSDRPIDYRAELAEAREERYARPH